MTKLHLIIICTFILSGCGSWKYNKSSDDVTFEIRSWNHDPIIKSVKIADAQSFEDLGDGFGKDGQRVYYKGKEIPSANPKTFQVIHQAYSGDDSSIFLFTCKLKDADPRSFQLLEGFWSKDSERVWHGHRLISANAGSFRYLSDSWAIDNFNAYHAVGWASLGCNDTSGIPVKIFDSIDIESFEVIDGFYAKDKNRSYGALSAPNK